MVAAYAEYNKTLVQFIVSHYKFCKKQSKQTMAKLHTSAFGRGQHSLYNLIYVLVQ